VFGGAGIVALVLSAVGLSRLEPAAPTVEKGPLWTDTVRRGDMVRQVKGPGTLVAEEIHWIPAVTPGRIERKLVEPGSTVAEGTIIVELSNPDAERQELEARRQLTASEAELANLRSTLENQRLTQEGTVATVTSEFREATRQVRTTEALARQNMAAPQELEKARDRVGELQTRLDVERKRLGFMTTSMRTQISAQQAQVAMLRTLAAFQLRQMDAMHVRAGTAGVLQELPVEMGQWVNSGATLAKVVQPGRLKAVLRIPETQAKDVAVGQPASIDTRNGIVKGHVVRIDPSVQNGTVTVDVALEGALPQGARPDLSVDGTVDIERLHDVLYVGRPAYGQPESVVGLFKLSPSGDEATRTNVRLGRGSASTIEVTAGLKQGDIVIISDMSNWDSANRLRLK
jgi:multidrug resistance efflux pump